MGKEYIYSGVATKNIYIPLNMEMIGYSYRETGAQGIHDELKIKCIIIGNYESRIAFVTCDLLAISDDFANGIISLLKTSLNLVNIIISCTHTHSGPASLHVKSINSLNNKWLEQLRQDIIQCITEASFKMEFCLFEYISSYCNIGVNRVLEKVNNSSRKIIGGTGIDNQINIMVIKGENFELKSILVNFACHPVTLENSNLLYSNDYIYYFEKTLKQHLGNINIFFFNGCCGDINPIERGDYSNAKKMGNILATSILDAVNNLDKSKFVSQKLVNIYSHTDVISMPIIFQVNESNFARKKQEFEYAARLAKHNKNFYLYESYKSNILWVDRMIDKYDTTHDILNISCQINYIQIDKIIFITLPFEVFHEIGLEIKKIFESYNTFVICYCNGAFGYLPSERLYEFAKYEVEQAHIFYNLPGPFLKTSSSILYDKLQYLLSLRANLTPD